MKRSKYLYAVALIISVAGCQRSPNARGPVGSPSAGGTPSVPLLPPSGVLTRVAELSYSGGFVAGSALRVPAVVAYSDGTVVFDGHRRLTLTPGALDMLVSALQQDLKGQPGGVLKPKDGHAIPDVPTTVVGVYQPGGGYQTVAALGLDTSSESQYPAPVADAFAKLHALTSDATTPYTTTKVRYNVTCPSTRNGPGQPWPKALPQPGAGQPNTCLEQHVADGALAGAVRVACTETDTRQPQPAMVVYRADNGPRVCIWRYALPDENP